jgi:hypothetical protein
MGTIPLVKTQNQLWGDWYIISEGRAIGDNLVAIEAADPLQYFLQSFAVDPPATNYTFYGRYVGGDGSDQREPLASVWGVRYLQPNPVFAGGTDLFVWRDSKCGRDEAHSCEDGPLWANLEERQVVDFSLDEDAVEICGSREFGAGGGISPNPPGTRDDRLCFPIETGRYTVGGNNLNVQHDFGWLYLNLNHTLDVPLIVNDPDDPDDDIIYCDSLTGYFGDIAQSYVVASVDNDAADNFFNVGLPAVQLASACDFRGTDIDGNPATGGGPFAGDEDGDEFVEDDIPLGPVP